ncbi:Uncharacterized protein R883 [Durusdinium trenchii]|uniref:Uncharacterized protein R883 n=1 Tax=Durusdinium trenchii TaxID=1381693 RepID=A0ABP0R4A0_9DINO
MDGESFLEELRRAPDGWARRQVLQEAQQRENEGRVAFAAARRGDLARTGGKVKGGGLVGLFDTEKGDCVLDDELPRDMALDSKSEVVLFQNKVKDTPVVRSIDEFELAFLDVFSNGALRKINWDNVVVAGGSVVACMLEDCSASPSGNRDARRADLQRRFSSPLYEDSDIDLFLYGLDVDEANAKVQELAMALQKTIPFQVAVVRTAFALTFISSYPHRHIQIVLRLYSSVLEILSGFDVDCCTFAFDGMQVYATPRGVHSLLTGVNTIDLSRRSTSFEMRLAKYGSRGFGALAEDVDERRVSPGIYSEHVGDLRGLPRLFVLDTLLADGATLSEIKDAIRTHNKGKDTAPEQGSDYETMSLPKRGPRMTAKTAIQRVQRLDKSMNAESATRRAGRHFAVHYAACAPAHDVGTLMGDPFPTDTLLQPSDTVSPQQVFGPLRWLEDDPGRQQIGSFKPVQPGDWTKGLFVEDHKSLVTEAFDAIPSDDPDVVETKITAASADAGVVLRDAHGRSPLYVAIKLGAWKTALRLIQLLEDPALVLENPEGETERSRFTRTSPMHCFSLCVLVDNAVVAQALTDRLAALDEARLKEALSHGLLSMALRTGSLKVAKVILRGNIRGLMDQPPRRDPRELFQLLVEESPNKSSYIELMRFICALDDLSDFFFRPWVPRMDRSGPVWQTRSSIFRNKALRDPEIAEVVIDGLKTHHPKGLHQALNCVSGTDFASPLQWAVNEGDTELVSRLVQAGADPASQEPVQVDITFNEEPANLRDRFYESYIMDPGFCTFAEWDKVLLSKTNSVALDAENFVSPLAIVVRKLVAMVARSDAAYVGQDFSMTGRNPRNKANRGNVKVADNVAMLEFLLGLEGLPLARPEAALGGDTVGEWLQKLMIIPDLIRDPTGPTPSPHVAAYYEAEKLSIIDVGPVVTAMEALTPKSGYEELIFSSLRKFWATRPLGMDIGKTRSRTAVEALAPSVHEGQAGIGPGLGSLTKKRSSPIGLLVEVLGGAEKRQKSGRGWLRRSLGRRTSRTRVIAKLREVFDPFDFDLGNSRDASIFGLGKARDPRAESRDQFDERREILQPGCWIHRAGPGDVGVPVKLSGKTLRSRIMFVSNNPRNQDISVTAFELCWAGDAEGLQAHLEQWDAEIDFPLASIVNPMGMTLLSVLVLGPNPNFACAKVILDRVRSEHRSFLEIERVKAGGVVEMSLNRNHSDPSARIGDIAPEEIDWEDQEATGQTSRAKQDRDVEEEESTVGDVDVTKLDNLALVEMLDELEAVDVDREDEDVAEQLEVLRSALLGEKEARAKEDLDTARAEESRSKNASRMQRIRDTAADPVTAAGLTKHEAARKSEVSVRRFLVHTAFVPSSVIPEVCDGASLDVLEVCFLRNLEEFAFELLMLGMTLRPRVDLLTRNVNLREPVYVRPTLFAEPEWTFAHEWMVESELVELALAFDKLWALKTLIRTTGGSVGWVNAADAAGLKLGEVQQRERPPYEMMRSELDTTSRVAKLGMPKADVPKVMPLSVLEQACWANAPSIVRWLLDERDEVAALLEEFFSQDRETLLRSNLLSLGTTLLNRLDLAERNWPALRDVSPNHRTRFHALAAVAFCRHGNNLAWQNPAGANLVYYCIRGGSSDVLDELLRRDTRFATLSCTRDWLDPLRLSLTTPGTGMQCAKVLLRVRASAEPMRSALDIVFALRSDSGKNVLHDAVVMNVEGRRQQSFWRILEEEQHFLDEVLEFFRNEIAASKLQVGQALLLRDSDGRCALHAAAAAPQVLLGLMLEYLDDSDRIRDAQAVQSKSGSTVVHEIAVSGFWYVLSPKHLRFMPEAKQTRDLEALRCLVAVCKSFQDPEAWLQENSDGLSPLDLVIRKHELSTERLLESGPPVWSTLLGAPRRQVSANRLLAIETAKKNCRGGVPRPLPNPIVVFSPPVPSDVAQREAWRHQTARVHLSLKEPDEPPGFVGNLFGKCHICLRYVGSEATISHASYVTMRGLHRRRDASNAICCSCCYPFDSVILIPDR